jgi:hypothetical protein
MSGNLGALPGNRREAACWFSAVLVRRAPSAEAPAEATATRVPGPGTRHSAPPCGLWVRGVCKCVSVSVAVHRHVNVLVYLHAHMHVRVHVHVSMLCV